MKLFKKSRKGFTLVELIVVIAIVAILAAVSVVSYIAFINKGNESADIQLVKQLNICLQADEALNGKTDWTKNYSGLQNLLESNGFIVENLTKTRSGYDIVYQSKPNRYALLNGNAPVYSETTYSDAEKYKDIYIVKSLEEAKTATLAGKGVYLADSVGTVEEITVYGNFYAGNNDVKKVKYVNDTTATRQVVIDTNSELTTLEINAQNDTVYHYGRVGLVEIIKVGKNSYHEHGEVSLVKVANGRVVVNEDAEIGGIHAVATNDEFDDITVGIVGNSEVPTITRDKVSIDDSVDEGTYTQYVLEVQTIANEESEEANSEYIWISVTVDGEGNAETSTEVASSSEELTDETKIPAKQQSGAASSAAETATEGKSAEEVEKEHVATLINTMDELQAYITGDVVHGVIGRNIDVTAIMELGGDKILNLNGFTLNINIASGRPFVFSNNQKMTVNANEGGMKIVNSNAYGIFRIQSPLCELILNGGHYEGYTNNANAIIWVGNVNNLTYSVNIELNDLTVDCIGQFVRDTSCAGHPNYDEYRQYGVYANKLTVNGGNYTFNNGGINVSGSISGFVLQYMEVEFNGSTMTSAIGSIMELDGGVGVFKDNNFLVQNSNNIQEWNATCIGVAYEATITIKSGSYAGYFGISVFTSGGHIIMNGGTVSGTKYAFDLYDDDGRCGTGEVTTLDIYGGTINGDIHLEGTEAIVTDHR